MTAEGQALTQRPPRRWLGLVLGACAGLAWFAARGGLAVLPPGRLDWLLGGDPSANLTGWLHFRIAPWTWPLGSAPGLVYPLGASVATTDGIPWFAVIGKLLSPVLPADFQYLGLYLGLSFTLQGVMGARLTSLVSDRLVDQALGGAAFAVAPVLFARLGHTSLCGQWPVLLALDANLRPQADRRQAARTAALLAGALFYVSGVQPYLACMIFPFTLSFLWTCARERVVRWPWAAAAGGVMAAILVGTFLLFGFLGGSEPTGIEGFGIYQADVLSLVNSAGRSRFLPPIPATPRQWFEGFGYLGLGVLGLLAALGGALAARRRLPAGWRRILPVTVVALGWFFYSLSGKVTLAGREVLDLDGAYSHISVITSALRTSGRFVWPLHYLLTAAAVLGWLRWQRGRPAVAAAGLALAVALQVAEMLPPATIAEITAGPRTMYPPPDPAPWKALGRYEHLALVPARYGVQPAPWEMRLHAALAYVAYHLGATFNGGFTARMRHEQAVALSQALQAEVATGTLRPNTLYVFWPPIPPRDGWRCRVVEGFQACDAATAALSGSPPGN